MPNEYAYGTPSLEEWHGLWKTEPMDQEVTEEEFNNVYTSLDNWMSKYGKIGFEPDCDFFVVGDCQGDKTQSLELVNPNILSLQLLEYIQKWLNAQFPSWRVVIPTFLGPYNVIVVYKGSVRTNREYELDLKGGLDNIRLEMLLSDAYRHLRLKG